MTKARSTVLIEGDTEDLDLFVDLKALGEDVQPVTIFELCRRPAVKISGKQTRDRSRLNRYTTKLPQPIAPGSFFCTEYWYIADSCANLDGRLTVAGRTAGSAVAALLQALRTRRRRDDVGKEW